MASVAANLKKLGECKVLVAGDAMLDRYWFGAVERISPEAPVPVVTVESVDERIGGAGNVACNITALGGECTLLAVVGDDEAGGKVAEIAADAGVATKLVTDAACKTTIKLRVLSQNQQLLRADFESPPPPSALDDAEKKFAALLADHQAVVLSDYGKGGLAQVATLIKLARAKHVPVLVDPKGGDFSRYRGATMVTPNRAEFEAAVGAVNDDDAMAVKANELIARCDFHKLLVTLSDRGMVMFTGKARGQAPLRRASRVREVYDVSGAGDSVIAVMAMATATGLDDDTALGLANSAAGVVVSKLGTATATADELRAALARDY